MNQSAERMPSGAMSDEPAGVGDACERRNPLLETALFKQVSEEQARELVPYLHHEEYDKGEYIFTEGDTDQRMYVMGGAREADAAVCGQARAAALDTYPRRTARRDSRVRPARRPAHGERGGDGGRYRVVWLDHDALFAWLGKYPGVAVDMLQVLANRMRANNERIADLVFSDVPGRLAKTLLSLASRFGKPVEEGLQVPHDLTQEEMAQLVGSSRETVNKALMDFANRGWIARNGRTIIIYQPGALIRRSQR